MDFGLLKKVAAGSYALGARIIELDYQRRQSDPVLLAADAIMHELSNKTNREVVLTVLINRRQIIDIHRVHALKPITTSVARSRGRQRPMFRSGGSKSLLSWRWRCNPACAALKLQQRNARGQEARLLFARGLVLPDAMRLVGADGWSAAPTAAAGPAWVSQSSHDGSWAYISLMSSRMAGIYQESSLSRWLRMIGEVACSSSTGR